MIRKAETSDLIILERIAREVARGLNAEGISQWSLTYPGLQDFENDYNSGYLLVYEENRQVFGSVTIKPENDPAYRFLSWQGKKAFVIHRLMVLPDMRKRGIGKALFQAALVAARNAGADSVKVDTHPDNLRMQRLIECMGFTKIGYMKTINRIGYELIL